MSRQIKALRTLNAEDLLKKLAELRSEQFKLNASRASGTAQQDVAKFKNVRKEIARINTLLGEAKASSSKAAPKKAASNATKASGATN